MNILMLNYEFPPVGGGASPITAALARHLVLQGHDVDVVTMRYGDLPAFEQRDGINIYRTPALRRQPDICRTHEMATYLAGALPKTLELIRAKKYDIIHAHFIIPTGPLAWLVSQTAGVPFIVTCHGSDIPGYNPDRFGLTHKLIKPAWNFLVRRAALLVSPSRALRQLILQSCPDANVSVIPYGFDVQAFTPAPKQKRILLCSRILPRKGFQYALAAIKAARLSDWETHVIGEGPYLAELKKSIGDFPSPLRFWGWLDRDDPQFKELYETSAIFIFPSEMDNFPVALLEAMVSGMAIIASNAGGCPEVVGDAALLIPPRDSGAIGTQLAKLTGSEDLRQKLSNAALERIKEFSWPSIVQRYHASYQSILSQSERGV